MTSVSLSDFAVDVYLGKRDLTPQEAYDHINSPLDELGLSLTTRPRYEALQKSSVQALDGIVARYDLKMDQPLNAKTSEPGRAVSGIIHGYEERLCTLLVNSAWRF